MLNPFVNLLGNTLQLYMFCVIVWCLLASLISFRVVNAGQPVVRKVMDFLNQIVEPVLKYIRKQLIKLKINLNNIDISPVILLLLLGFVREALYTYLYNL